MSLLGGLPLARQGSFWFPPQASSVAAGSDFVYDLILWLCIIFFVGICGATGYFVWKYRARAGHKEQRTITHHLWLEISWSLIPLALLMVVFGISTWWYLEMVNPPKNEAVYDIDVTGQKWKWSFVYKGDPFDATMRTMNLHLIKDQPYRLTMISPDVIHSMYIPAFRVKQDCVPGRYNRLWFRPTMAGTFRVYCTEYCGDEHSLMVAWVTVYEDANAWRDAIIEEGDLRNYQPLERGAMIYDNFCKSCHTIDGRDFTGPSFLNLWGKTEELTDGSKVLVDANYIRESIREPGAKLVKGYANVMTPFNFSEIEYEGILAYLRSLQQDEALQKLGDGN